MKYLKWIAIMLVIFFPALAFAGPGISDDSNVFTYIFAFLYLCCGLFFVYIGRDEKLKVLIFGGVSMVLAGVTNLLIVHVWFTRSNEYYKGGFAWQVGLCVMVIVSAMALIGYSAVMEDRKRLAKKR